MKFLSRIAARISPPLPDVPPSDEDSLARARNAVEESSKSLVRAVAHNQAASRETLRIRQALSRNHLAPAFEAAMRRRGV